MSEAKCVCEEWARKIRRDIAFFNIAVTFTCEVHGEIRLERTQPVIINQREPNPRRLPPRIPIRQIRG